MISEQEQNGEALMTETFLAQIIRSYGRVAPAYLADYLEESLHYFLARKDNKPLTSGGQMP